MDSGTGTRTVVRTSLRYLPIGLALFALQLDFFSLSLAMPTIAHDLDVPVTDLQWLLAGYLLSVGATFVPAGKIGDTIGRRRALVVGLVVFGASSLACALSASAPLLILFRVVQGVGAGLVMPNAFALMGATIADGPKAKVMGLLLGLSGVGTALGPVVGGVLAETAGWQWVFLINLPVAVVAVIGAARLPESYGGGSRGSLRDLDWLGVGLVMSGLALTSVGIDNTSNLGFASPLTWGPLLAGPALLAWFVRHSAAVATPLVRFSLMRDRAFALLLLAGTVLNVGLNVSVFAATLELQEVDRMSAASAGLVFMLSSIGLASCGPAAGWLTATLGSRRVLAGSLLLGAVSVAALGLAPNLPLTVLALGVSGFACGMGFSVSQIGAQAILPPERAGEGSALLLTAIVSIGGIGVVVAGAVIEAISGTPTHASIATLLVGLAVLLAAAGVVTGVGSRRPEAATAARR
ncbi:MFS transporter [Agromyces arachidis]|uniref:MFS transporter n=1 Tax=Agromyces arachidis TaxID=766966 RepID=UPI004055B568